MPRQSGYSSSYANNIADIYRQLGQSQAEAKLRKGQAWAGAITDIGQIAAGIPGQLQQQKRADQESQIVEENLRRAAEQRQEDQWLKDAMNSSVVDGKIDERRLTENLTLLGAAELVPQAVEVIRKSDAALQQLKNAQQTGKINEQTLRGMAMDYFRPFAKVIKESNYDPGVVNGALSVVGLQAGPEEADNLRKSFAADPKSVAMMVESMLVTTKKDLMNVSEGAAIFDPNTGQQVFENVKPDPTQNLDQMLAAALKAGDRAKVNEIIKLKGQEAAATRAPQQGAQPNYREINTVDEAGNPILKFMTPEQVNAMGGVKTSPKTTAKATGPAAVDAVLGEIEDLSKRINTVASGPGANIQGMVRRGASALNMDNEVSEYQRLVEGFIPIMARSVGHTGVLTQMDVDSTKALFPKVGDNSTLSTNLIARVKRIMSALQDPSVAALGPDASFSAKMAAAQAIANKGGGKSPTTPDPLGIRK